MPCETKQGLISVIICTYNRGEYIYSVLESLAKNDFPTDRYEIVLVDNNCTDCTRAEVLRFAADRPDVHFRYFLETAQGLSFARNRGICEAQGDVLVFLDDDAFPGTGYLATLDEFLRANPGADGFGGKIIPVFEDGKAPAWLCRWTRPWLSALDLGQEPQRFVKKFPIGANMGFRRRLFDNLGGFNTNLGRTGKNLTGGEEKEFFLRVKAAGADIRYIPGIEVRHIIPPSRTTTAYVKKLGRGVGMSERIRTAGHSRGAYLKRLLSELVKWCATLVLWAGYLVCLRPACGNALVRFRWNVTRGLFDKTAYVR